MAIEDVGMMETYDMEVPETHCFFGNDILVHNSGDLEEDADVIMLIDRKRDEEATQLIVAKNRNGPIGTVKLRFNPERACFNEVDRRDEE